MVLTDILRSKERRSGPNAVIAQQKRVAKIGSLNEQEVQKGAVIELKEEEEETKLVEC